MGFSRKPIFHRGERLSRTKARQTRYLRTLLVQGAQHILGPFGADCDLRRWG